MKWVLVILAPWLASMSACDKGLEPPPPINRADTTSVNGRIVFKGKWPSDSTNKILALVLFREDPPFPVSDVIKGYINKTLVVEMLSTKPAVDTVYHMFCDTGHYGYLGVAQQFGDSIAVDWHVVGFSHNALDSALKFDFKKGDSVVLPDIIVNFDSLPRSPFK